MHGKESRALRCRMQFAKVIFASFALLFFTPGLLGAVRSFHHKIGELLPHHAHGVLAQVSLAIGLPDVAGVDVDGC